MYDPSIFATPPPPGEEGREYWRGRDGKGGYRADAVLRRYLDIVHKYVLGEEPPKRSPLFLPSDELNVHLLEMNGNASADDQPPLKKQKIEEEEEEEEQQQQQKKKNGKQEKVTNANLVAMQAHCFHILRPLVSKHHDVRDALARSRAGDIPAYEKVLTLTEKAVKEGLLAYASNPSDFEFQDDPSVLNLPADESSDEAVRRCRRPYWVCQPYVRPLPKEALEKGSLSLSKKQKAKLAKAQEEAKASGVKHEGKVEVVDQADPSRLQYSREEEHVTTEEVPREGLVCG